MSLAAFASGSLPGPAGVCWAVTARDGGVSPAPFDTLNLADAVGDDARNVRENRERAAMLVGLPGTELAVTGSVHGAQVSTVDSGGVADGSDAVITRRRGLALASLAADCVPIGLADPQAGVIGAVHCGWRGVLVGVVAATVDRLRASGARTIVAVVGPSVCWHCYPVPSERLAELRSGVSPEVYAAAAGGAEAGIDRDGSARMDVAGAVLAQLAELAITVAVRVSACTVESPDLFSYRRDQRTGRHGLLIAMPT